MGIFKKLFGKKEHKETPGTTNEHANPGDTAFKISRPLSPEMEEKLAASTLQVMVTQLFMHYWTDNLVCNDPEDQHWQNQAVFFWKAEEPFPKKSLPPEFETYNAKHFIFIKNKEGLSLKRAQVMPWFGMPGLGEKFFCEHSGRQITIPELKEMGIIQYLEMVELSEDNTSILTNREQYFFLADERIVQCTNKGISLNNKPIPLEAAYSIGGIHIVKEIQ